MKPEAQRSFYRFFFGFLAILLISFIVTGVTSYISESHVEEDTQPACQEGTTC